MAGATGHQFRAMALVAAGLWFAAGLLFLGVEGVAASAYIPSYSYARNYISDLGLPACGIMFSGAKVCSPFHWLMNADFGLQGLLFLSAATVAAWRLETPTKFVFIGCAALNCAGNILIGLFPVQPVHGTGDASPVHIAGALLAIVFGNAAALMSAWTFRELRLSRVHRWLSIALALLAAVSLTMLVSRVEVLPDGVWERMSVYTITAWQIVSAACVIARARGRHRP